MKKHIAKTIATVIVSTVFLGPAFGQTEYSNLKKTEVSTEELSQWRFYGSGEVSTWGDQVSLKESDDSKGVTLVSPEVYSGDVILQYKALALTPATVIVTMLSASDAGDSTALTVSEDYDGSIGLWTSETENYFFAFKNAPHGVTPFVRKSPNAEDCLGLAEENVMVAGVYYAIEVGRKGDKLWLSIDGEKVFESTDEDPLTSGHVALRLRGTAGFPAGCLFRDLVIYHAE